MLLNRTKSLFFLMSVLVSWNSYSINLLAWAQTEVNNNQVSSTQMNLTAVEKDPPKRGTPPGKEGTGSRGDCIYQQDKPPLTHIVGGNQSHFSVKDYPTIWVYLPYSAQEVTNAEFSLQDGDTEVYRTHFNLPNKAGIIGITLPSSIPALKVDKKYRWYVDVNCSPNISSDNSSTPASLTGVVQRKLISVELERDLKTAKTPLEKIFVYAKHDIWYEAITELAELRLNEPNNSSFKKVWVELLNTKALSLANISEEPIIVNIILN
ncbi:DUF928 domain-containing protein [Nostoc sp. 106C]|uniref:DUF928 domain-containing protein n=1 Tax=Nostoc sp. 106C TaxID=1932667 RepID=UPI000A3A051B|nr:DUF928 domain-containing protein [Nostoc sp. 106C]OUL18806.1 hypothetical protein BV375_33325 [Nostoc sp. 106C]